MVDEGIVDGVLGAVAFGILDVIRNADRRIGLVDVEIDALPVGRGRVLKAPVDGVAFLEAAIDVRGVAILVTE